MKRYLPFIVLGILLATAIGWFVFTKTNSTLSDDENNFSVKNTADVTTIVLLNAKGEKLSLQKGEGRWMVNNKYEARPELITQMLDILSRQTSLAPVAKSAHDNVMREMMAQYIKVSVYTGSDTEAEKVFYVGGATVDSRATYMILEHDGQMAARPHMVYVPGRQGYLTPIYAHLDEEEWRSRIVFKHGEGDIQTLELNYAAEPEKSFRITRVEGDSFRLEPLSGTVPAVATYTHKYVRQYVYAFTEIHAEAFDNSYSKKDSTMGTTPYCTFNIRSTNGKTNTVHLWRMPVNKRSKAQYDELGRPITYDVDRFYASINNGRDFVIVQYYVFGRLLRSYKDFFYKAG